MKTATITLLTTPNIPIPTPPKDVASFGAWAGFKITLTAASGANVTPPVSQQLTWIFSELTEGASYSLKVESVDANGATIQGLPVATITAPIAATYTRIDSFGVQWS